MLGPEILSIVGVILLVKFIPYGIGWLVSLIPSKPSPPDPMAVAPKVRKEDSEIYDIDTYEDDFGNKYRYDRRNGELIDKNHQRIKASKAHGYDWELEDSKGHTYYNNY